ncbi:MAG: RipA family octameric membrane protein [Ginsengibacter sp.]
METEKKVNETKYESALQLLFYEGQIAWQMNLLFIGLNVGIGAIISSELQEFNPGNLLLIIISIIGIIINILWLGTFNRNNSYYHFRMAQAREAEPQNWSLLADRGYRFSKGEAIIIDNEKIDPKDKDHKLTAFERYSSNKRAILISIWIFILGFSLILVGSIPCINRLFH